MDYSQQSSSSQPLTGNPQAIPAANLQPLAPQSGFLQNAGNQSVEAVNMLDQGSKALQTSVANNAVALSNNSPSATVPLDSPVTTPFPTRDVVLYGGIAVAVILCMVVLGYGLLRPQHSRKPRRSKRS